MIKITLRYGVCIISAIKINIREREQMTIEECYEAIESDYNGVLKRFGNDAMVKRFAIKFLNDPSFNELKDGIKSNDVERAFRAAHTLKGICLNLGFDKLFEVSSALTEELRGKDKMPECADMFAAVEKQYDVLIENIKKVEA